MSDGGALPRIAAPAAGIVCVLTLPVRHRVINTDPPTWCPRCGRFHGLGELNEP